MDSAQDKYTGEIVDAEQLWLLDVVDKERYICRGCGIKVKPASYQSHNVVRPYFTKDVEHQIGCDIDGEKKLVAKGKKGRLSTTRDGFPVSYPSRLVLRDICPVVDVEMTNCPDTVSVSGRSRVGGVGVDQGRGRRRDVNTIRLICRTFINYPYDRDLELAIPGIDATSYRSVFKKLKWDELVRYTNSKLFYAAIRWSKPVETDEYLEITVDAGERDASKRLLRGHHVRVEWATWSKAKRSYVRNEIDAARKEAIDAKNENPKIKGYLFFIGEQNVDDESIFHVADHRLICCLVDEITYPAID